MLLRARAWQSAGFVLSPQQQLLSPDRLLPVQHQDVLVLPSTTSDPGSSPIEIELTPSGERGIGSAAIIIGHIKPNKVEGKGSNLEFVLEGLTDDVTRRGFSADAMKGSVEAGGMKQVLLRFLCLGLLRSLSHRPLMQTQINISFTLHPESMRNSEAGIIASFGVSQWTEAYLKLVLKGGNPPPQRPETRIIVKGFIPSNAVSSQ